MAITIKCPDCGHTEQSADGAAKTCPGCEGTMAAPPKKKYQAKATSLEDEEHAKKKKPKTRDEDDEDDRPKPKKRAAEALSLDDDEDEDASGADEERSRNEKVAKRLGLDPGFKNRLLMKQVKEELARGEVLYFACRPSVAIAKKQALVAVFTGLLFSLIGAVVAAVMLRAGSDKVPTLAVIVPGAFVLIGVLIAILGPIMKNRQARLGWYAVTDRRAVVFSVALWGKSGHVETYQPAELRKMWIKKSFWLTGGGDLVFKTIITQRTRTERDPHTGRTRTSTSTSKEHFGFLGVEDVKDVQALVHEVLLSGRRDDGDDDDDD